MAQWTMCRGLGHSVGSHREHNKATENGVSRAKNKYGLGGNEMHGTVNMIR